MMIAFKNNRPFLQTGHCVISDYDVDWMEQVLLEAAQDAGTTLPCSREVAQAVMLYLEKECPLHAVPLDYLFNRIRKIGQRALSDMGGIYTLGTSFGTRLYNNVISDIDAYTYGGWGLYPDEGSEGITLENNLVYDTKDASMHQHYGRNNILRNNILCFSRECQVAVTRVEPHRSMTIERNILYWQKGDAFGTRYRGIANGAKLDWSKNLWWCCAGEPRFNGKSYAEWQTGGRDAGGLVADPGFVNPAARDFRLRPGSPALKLGFKPFDPAEAGCNLTLNR